MVRWTAALLLMFLLPLGAFAAEPVIADNATATVTLSDGTQLTLWFRAGTEGQYRVQAALERNRLLEWDLIPLGTPASSSPADKQPARLPDLPTSPPPLKFPDADKSAGLWGGTVRFVADQKPRPSFSWQDLIDRGCVVAPGSSPPQPTRRMSGDELPIAILAGPTTLAPGGLALLTTTGSRGTAYGWVQLPKANPLGVLIPIQIKGSTDEASLFQAGQVGGTATIGFGATNGTALDVAVLNIQIGEPTPTVLGLTVQPSILEGQSGQANITSNNPGPFSVAVTNSAPARLATPPVVPMPSGQRAAPFTAAAVADGIVNGDQSVTVTASAGKATISATTTVVDKDTPPVPTKMQVVIVWNDLTAANASTIWAQSITDYLTSKRHVRRPVHKDVLAPNGQPPPELAAALALAKTKVLPWVVLTDLTGKTVVADAALPATPAEFLTWIKSKESPAGSAAETKPAVIVEHKSADLSLLCFYDFACRNEVLPITYSLDQKGFKVALADMDKPENKEQCQRYAITRLPHWTLYWGHEALENTEGTVSEPELRSWVWRAYRNELPSGGRFRPDTSQQFLGPLDRACLRQHLTPGSCGMLGCGMHGGGVVVEYATKPVPRQQPCPTCAGGVCPTGGG